MTYATAALAVMTDERHSIPGVQSVDWLDVCHQAAPFVWIMHMPHRNTSRHTIRHNKRQWHVFFRTSRRGLGEVVSKHLTPEAAAAAAIKLATR